MTLGIGSLLYMGILEILRKKDLEDSGGMMQNVGIFMYNASDISILWQVPQFVLNGIGETFTSITGKNCGCFVQYIYEIYGVYSATSR